MDSGFKGSFSLKTRGENIKRLRNERFQIIVIGGGITGAGIARDAAMRGVKTALIEKADFGWGTSSRSSKMIHGGLRYLKQLHIRLVRESLREREILLHLAPHLIHATPFLIPIYKGGKERKFHIEIGLFGYDLLAGSKSVGHHKKLSKEEILEIEPLIRAEGLKAGFIYYDCLVNDARLTLATVKSAHQNGAVIANYMKATGFVKRNGKITGVKFRDELSGETGVIEGDVFINAAGVWVDSVRDLAGDEPGMLRPTKGVHIVFPRKKLNVNNIVIIPAKDNRIIFTVPYGDFVYVGTTDTDYNASPDEVRTEREDVDYLFEALGNEFKGCNFKVHDIISTWAGVRPLIHHEGEPSEVSRDYKITIGDNGLVSIAGGKLTTYRAMAEQLIDEVLERFWGMSVKQFGSCKTADKPLFGGDIKNYDEFVRSIIKGMNKVWGISEDAVRRLINNYGTDFLKILGYGLDNSKLLRPVHHEIPLMGAEVIYGVEEEMTLTLLDFMERRTELMHFTTDNGMSAARTAARIMGKRLKWSWRERRRQIIRYREAVGKMFIFNN
ncbi:MAG: glycerol-3-phosphate dehydrogenase [Fidelibacterota bacterium]